MKYILPIVLLSSLCGYTQPNEYPALVEETAHLRDSSMSPFYHGVASGDPLYNQVIIWTRVTPEDSVPEVDVIWQVARDQSFQKIVKSGTVTTDPVRDYTVKVDVEGLEVGTEYYYRFQALKKSSIIGRTKTAPKNPNELRVGVVSCANYEWGYFNSYKALAEEDLDAVVHLGDYIYEYGVDEYGDSTLMREHIPSKEIILLDDYRTRYSQYRLDEGLRSAHARHPFINIWDDHEIANDSYQDGAQNHQKDEGSYEARKEAARQAFYEWLPIREGEHYRKFDFGSLATLIMLDERLEGRTFIADSLKDPSLADSARTMLGDKQRNWLITQLRNSDAIWKIVGNQVIFSYLNYGHPTFTINLDSWDGYPIERQKLADVMRELEDIVIITGDTHRAFAFEATNRPHDDYDPITGEGAFAVEFGTTSINSSNSNESYPDSLVLLHEKHFIDSPINPHLKYGNTRDHGFMILSITREKTSATWKFVETLRVPNPNIKDQKTIWVKRGETRLQD